MAAEYPLLMLPEPSEQVKGDRNGGPTRLHRPDIAAQGRRLEPMYKRLCGAFDRERVKVQRSPDRIEPELALVFEVAGSLNSFYGAVKRIEGLEWLFDLENEDMAPDNYFYDEENAEASFSGRVYCIMSDRAALDQLISTWKHYQMDETFQFPHGFTSLRDLFGLLREVHVWGPEDRFEDTGILEDWHETIQVKGSSPSTFEAELFYRSDPTKRCAAAASVRRAVEAMNGRVTSECAIEEIRYHGMLLELPIDQIENLLGAEREKLSLATCNEIMYFRPTGQMAVGLLGEIFEEDIDDKVGAELPSGVPIVGMLDGLPLENHAALRNRIIVDDPDEFGNDYPASLRMHGTAMASMLVHGDLAAPEPSTASRPVYVRPVMRPDAVFGMKETYPENVLIVDLIHRAVRRMFDGDGDEAPAAPTLHVINLSIGDEVRQFFGAPSPLAKLLDWLSYKYRVLFVISAGNQHINLIPVEGGFEKLKDEDLERRSKHISEALMENRRNLKLLSPAESINSITVGATFEDNTAIEENALAVQPVEEGCVSPLTSFGGGIGRSIKPEILYPGGKFLVSAKDDNCVEYALSQTREPGIIAAAPTAGAIAKSYVAQAGTSYSAAAVSHECAANFDVLEEIFLDSGFAGVPDEYGALLLKAMAVHGCAYENLGDIAFRQFGAKNKESTRWVGFGRPDYLRVRECALNRVTAFGFGDIGKDEGQLFHVPLPLDFSSRVVDRRLTVTLAYFTPIAFGRQEYRHAQLWFDRVGLTKERLVPTREYTDWNAIRRGTLQHQSFIGEGGLPWAEESDGIDILVSCAGANGLKSLGKEKIPYSLVVTFETKQPINVYHPVADRLRAPVGVRANAV